MFDKLKRVFKSITDTLASTVKETTTSIKTTITEAITTTTLSQDKVREVCDDLFIQLVECDVAVEVAEEIRDKVESSLINLKVPRFGDKESIIKNCIKNTLLELLSEIPNINFIDEISRRIKEKKPQVLLFLGPNGYGKTTSIAKIAHLLQRHGYSVVFAAADTFRAGAIEQLEEHGRRLGVKVIKHRYGSDPAAVAYDAVRHAEAKGIDFVMIDTAGRMHTDVNLMNELRKIYKVAEPDFSIFVADALLGNEALEVAKTYMKYVNIDGLIVTKVDAYPKGGSILTFLLTLKKPIIFIGTGQRYEDLKEFRKDWFIDQILSE